jgi:hypothetical protein
MTVIPIVTSVLVTTLEIKEWVLSLPSTPWNAFWDDDDPVRGCFTVDGQFLSFSGDTELNPYYDPEDIAALTIALGAPPVCTLEISLGGYPRNREAALKVAQLLLSKWKGVLEEEVFSH